MSTATPAGVDCEPAGAEGEGYRNISGHDVAQFTLPGRQVILDPPQFKTGALQYPYSEARAR